MQLVDSSTENRAEVLGEPVSEATFQAVSAMTSALTSSSTSPSMDATQPREQQPTSELEGGYPVWRIACGDMINRDRCIAVYVDGKEVVVVGPPGESARLAGSQLAELRTALDEAAELAER